MTKAATLEAPPRETPAALGFTMPGEFEKHAGEFAFLAAESNIHGVFLEQGCRSLFLQMSM